MPLNSSNRRDKAYKPKNIVKVTLDRKQDEPPASAAANNSRGGKEESEKVKKLREVYGDAAKRDY